ncbi:MAG: hypothetical protein MUF21_11665 [Gemmatimonadaceae bacterium]|nr:hypothetical protein [Gemmatimonadaceae bacterium]
MATTVAAPTYAPPATAAAESKGGIWSWIATTDHKKIGVLYLFTALFFFIFGGSACCTCSRRSSSSSSAGSRRRSSAPSSPHRTRRW